MSFLKKTIALLLFCFINLSLSAEIRIISSQPTDTFLFYSSSPGQPALDGTARNSPFTESFLKNVDKREPLLMVAVDIISDTLALTSLRQRPTFETNISTNKDYSIANGSSAKRYALVIGIDEYYYANANSTNAVNDVRDITRTLRKFGYEVDLRIDVDFASMYKAIDDFIGKLKADKDSEGFFWFGGHGIQIEGINYLLPADVDFSTTTSTQVSSFSVASLFQMLELAGNKINLVFLDAGRTTPFSWTR